MTGGAAGTGAGAETGGPAPTDPLAIADKFRRDALRILAERLLAMRLDDDACSTLLAAHMTVDGAVRHLATRVAEEEPAFGMTRHGSPGDRSVRWPTATRSGEGLPQQGQSLTALVGTAAVRRLSATRPAAGMRRGAILHMLYGAVMASAMGMFAAEMVRTIGGDAVCLFGGGSLVTVAIVWIAIRVMDDISTPGPEPHGWRVKLTAGGEPSIRRSLLGAVLATTIGFPAGMFLLARF